ncbi:DUF3857 and transglutaminase domain-containing protein [Cyclobacterium marinum]|uniref:DUF3857 domain-containing transglutaminase family protein n=1 Tax=Cyclobacterium marinum TaxID=104 RepID=UPI0030D78182|tara:strand:- start:94836 stop:96665 length:1830 start_codon:yes stop_codon:yes gene_type:complete
MYRYLSISIFYIFLFSPLVLNGTNFSTPNYSSIKKDYKITLSEDYSYEIEINQVTTIYDKNGLSHASYHFIIDQFTSLDNFEVKIIDPFNEKTIKKIKAKDLQERDLITSGNIYQDLTLKQFNLQSSSFPVRVEMKVKLRKSGNFYFPTWRPQNNYHQKVEQARLEVIYPESLGIRFKTQHFEGAFDTNFIGENHTLVWTINDLAPVAEDTEETDLSKITLAPEKFGMDGFEARMDTWKNFGLWFHQLNKERTKLPDAFKQELHEMVKGVDNSIEKIEILYRYLQKNYRYVSIQLGLGGWRPMESEEVLSKKYGDCKGLTLFMQAMLSEVGIPSDYTLVKAGEDPTFDEDFPSNQFNHAILRIKSGDKKYWLECTSSHLPAGFLGSFTRNRKVLVITPEGGEVDQTPTYSDPDFNTTVFNSSILLQQNGNAAIKGTLLQKGFPAEITVMKTYDKKEDEITNLFNGQIGGNGLIINDISLDKKIEWQDIQTQINFSGMVQRYYKSTGKRIFIPISWHTWEPNLKNTSEVYMEEVNIKKHRSLNTESIPPSLSITEDNYELKMEIIIDDENILIKKQIQFTDTDRLSEEEQSELLIALNKKIQGELVFTKQ